MASRSRSKSNTTRDHAGFVPSVAGLRRRGSVNCCNRNSPCRCSTRFGFRHLPGAEPGRDVHGVLNPNNRESIQCNGYIAWQSPSVSALRRVPRLSPTTGWRTCNQLRRSRSFWLPTDVGPTHGVDRGGIAAPRRTTVRCLALTVHRRTVGAVVGPVGGGGPGVTAATRHTTARCQAAAISRNPASLRTNRMAVAPRSHRRRRCRVAAGGA